LSPGNQRKSKKDQKISKPKSKSKSMSKKKKNQKKEKEMKVDLLGMKKTTQ
jgi:hypothetical protein